MDTEQKPKKGIKHDLSRLAILIILAVVTIIVATVLANVFGGQHIEQVEKMSEIQ